MAGRPEFLSVLGRVRFSLSNGNFPSLNFKPLQVKCFESILKGQDIIEVSYLLNLASRCYFTALYRSRLDKAGSTNAALVKATKHKANAATNEVRVENRSHGLAWSQSGNNKTAQTLLSFIIRKLLPRKEIRRAPVKTHITFMKTPSSSLLSHNAITRHSWCSFSLSCTLFL